MATLTLLVVYLIRGSMSKADDKWYAKNKEQKKAYARARYKLKPRVSPHLRDPDKHRRSKLFNRYGITLEEYNQMQTSRAGVCEICNEVYAKPLHVDHCHTSGKVRGLLCPPCNKGIGHLKDNPEILRRAIVYLERDNARFREAPG